MPIKNLAAHLVIAAAVAALLSWLRGGFEDHPGVVLFFGLLGFLGSLLFSAVLRPAPQRWIDARLGRSAGARALRHLAALVVVVGLFLWAGGAVLDAGVGAWLLLVLICAVAPLVVCLLAPRWHLAWAFVVATTIALSVWRESLQRPWARSDHPVDVLPVYVFTWLIALAIAAAVAIPRYLGHRAASKTVDALRSAGSQV